MNGYENAPATMMLATVCACCARPLVDAVSVETGVGPDCRKKHGYETAQLSPDWETAMRQLDGFVSVADVNPTMEPRAACNKLVHDIAVEQAGEGVSARVCAIRALGFVTLAERIAKRVGTIVVRTEGNNFIVQAPYNESCNAAVRYINGARWLREIKARSIPVASRTTLWNAFKSAFPSGTVVQGDRGYAVL